MAFEDSGAGRLCGPGSESGLVLGICVDYIWH
jgi:hypothetical protein